MTAVNIPTLVTRKVTVEIDRALAETQLSRITDVLQNRDYQLSRQERAALDGTRNLLAALTEVEVKAPRIHAKRVQPEDVNRIRDLHMAGKTDRGIAEQMGLRVLAVQRLILGGTYTSVPYKPSEFHLSGFNKLAGTKTYPWTKAWKP